MCLLNINRVFYTILVNSLKNVNVEYMYTTHGVAVREAKTIQPGKSVCYGAFTCLNIKNKISPSGDSLNESLFEYDMRIINDGSHTYYQIINSNPDIQTIH